MIKKIIEYTDIDENFEEIERTETVRFFYTLRSIKNYEQKTKNNFFEEYDKVFFLVLNTVSGACDGDVKKLDLENLTGEQLTALAPLAYDGQINKFVMDFAPCMYANVDSGRIVQDEETIEEAEDSLWIPHLINAGFFTDMFVEISKNQFKTPTGKSNSKKK